MDVKTLNWKKHAAIGAIYAGLAVAFGAFGAHVLEARLSQDSLSTYETAARYHMYHALGLVLTAILAAVRLGLAAAACRHLAVLGQPVCACFDRDGVARRDYAAGRSVLGRRLGARGCRASAFRPPAPGGRKL
jgi:hypothetical protein